MASEAPQKSLGQAGKDASSEAPQKSVGRAGKGLNIRDVLTDEQIASYRKSVVEQGGFHVPNVAPDPNLESVIRYSRSAIKRYNKKNGTNYKFVRTVHANVVGISDFILCLAFAAKDKDDADGRPEIFRANVFEGNRQPIHVIKTNEAFEDVFKK